MHDKNGRPLVQGDRVTITGRITAVYATDDYCNVTVETEEPMYPGTTKTSITLNSRQVEYAPPAATIAQPAPIPVRPGL